MAEYCESCMQPVDGAGSCPFCGNNREIANDNWQLQPGTILQERYLLGRVLGAGGFGITYIGMDLRLSRRVAVKEYYPVSCAHRVSAYSPVVTVTDSQADFARKGKEDFIREARILAALPRTPGIVEVHDFFEDNGTAYIVMEYLEGHTLKHMLSSRCFTADEIFKLMQPVLDALEVVHGNNLVHRDISPDNLMLCKNGKLVLMDFGSARQIIFDDPKSMTLVIKRGYAPEEQYRSRGEVGPWTDIYALCATIYHCLTGIVPEESVERMAGDTTLWPSAMGIAITSVQESVLKKGMAVHARDRYRSVGELREALSTRDKTETVTSTVQSPVNRAISETAQKKQAWQQVPPAASANPTLIPDTRSTTETMLPHEKERQQAGIHRIPVTPAASGAQNARNITVSAEAPEAAPTSVLTQAQKNPEKPEISDKPKKTKKTEKTEKTEKPEKTKKSPAAGKLIALVVAVALVLCIGIVAMTVNRQGSSAEEEANGSEAQLETLNAASTVDATAATQEEMHDTASTGDATTATQVEALIAASAADAAEETQVESLTRVDIGDTIFFGTYEQDNDASNGAEEIEWLVLDRDGDNVLLLSQYGLEAKPFHTEETDVTWEDSTLRRWLNKDFYATAFSAEEQRLIKTTTVTADSNPKYDTRPGNDTQDKIFLLSIPEVEKYRATAEARMCAPTKQAVADKAYISEDGTTWWWLRSPGKEGCNATRVCIDGAVSTGGLAVSVDDGCVRPALWVNLAS